MTETVIKDSKTDLEVFTGSLYQYCLENNFGLAIWSLPGSETRHVLISYSPQLVQTEKIESLESGFVIAAFETGAKGEKLYLKADIYFNVHHEEEFYSSLLLNVPGIELSLKNETSEVHYIPTSDNDIGDYKGIVNSAINVIQKGEFKKLVLARKKTASFYGSISVGKVFGKITRKFPGTFNSFVYTPQYGLWLGASPETLVSRDKNGIFKTIALAGTQRANGKSAKEAVWSQKEIEEQAYVSKFIVERLKKIRLREFEDIGPKTMQVGNLFHLKTEFIVDLKEVDFPDLLSDMLEMLHPTSAVCGMPKDQAFKFVLDHESFSRELYSGYLGPVNMGGETHIFVNLRCVKVTSAELTFYAGAGITEDSDPGKEFLETESKMESLMDCF